jgi:peptide/nickel transport system permease protein
VSAVPVTPGAEVDAPKRKGFWSLLGSTGPAGIASAVIIVVAIVIAVVGPFITTSDPMIGQLSQSYVGTIAGHPLGFDGQGRDVVSRLLAGARSSMLGPLAVVVVCMTIGTVFAVTSAWKRGTYDAVVSSGMDILFAFPGILLAILAATVFGAGLPAAALALAIAYTPYVARVLRGAALKERGQQYVDALSVQGASSWSIGMKHLIPNMTPLIVAQATILFGYAMVDLAAISFLGLGVQPPNPDWGVMVSENQSGVVQGYPLPALAAGICIVLVVVAFNVLGERLYERAEARNR